MKAEEKRTVTIQTVIKPSEKKTFLSLIGRETESNAVRALILSVIKKRNDDDIVWAPQEIIRWETIPAKESFLQRKGIIMKKLAVALALIVVLSLIFIKVAKAYDNCPLGGGLPPLPNYLACSFGKKPYNVKICDNYCNCYYVTQCR